MYRFTEDCMREIKEIDDEHRNLFAMLNEVMALIENGSDSGVIIRNLLLKLKGYAATHFAHEEEYIVSLAVTP
ncbi:MAG: hemerythrin domain-containing protein [Thermoflexaceae bacterium]|nr:hemerythrin domain-containing protein [Thermoflexaceae bacterium]